MAKLRRYNHQRACPTSRGRERHPDTPRHHRNTQLYIILNLKMTLTCEACNWTFQTRHQYDKLLKLNHLGQQYRCYHCQKNFRTKKDRILHATIAYPNALAKSFPPRQSLGTVETQPNWHPHWCQQQAIKNLKTTTVHPPETPAPGPHVSHCTHHLYIDDTCAIKLGPTQGPPLMFE